MTETEQRPRNVAKVLAKLNTKIMPLEHSPGHSTAAPAETGVDVAGALGAASHGPGRRLAILVLCLRWWPGIFEGPVKTVGHHEVPRQFDVRRKGETVTHRFLERMPVTAPAETAAFVSIADLIATAIRRRIAKDLSLAEQELGANLWAEMTKQRRQRPRSRRHALPLTPALQDRVGDAFTARWARTIIAEYRQPNHCQTCTPWGRVGEVPKPIAENGKIVRVEWTTCETCYGSGVLSWSVKRRAKALQIGEHPFRNYLNPHHDGALSLLRELEWRGARALLKHLSDER